ncbi:subtilase 4.12 [Trifolium repens]|nr:subtilase 4.12 [Trifolium repens]
MEAKRPSELVLLVSLVQGYASIDNAFSLPLPGCYLQSEDAASSIHKYIHSRSSPRATIFKTDELENTLVHVAASLSSRGLNIATPDILKLAVIAPGIDILASWYTIVPPSEVDSDARILE